MLSAQAVREESLKLEAIQKEQQLKNEKKWVNRTRKMYTG